MVQIFLRGTSSRCPSNPTNERSWKTVDTTGLKPRGTSTLTYLQTAQRFPDTTDFSRVEVHFRPNSCSQKKAKIETSTRLKSVVS